MSTRLTLLLPLIAVGACSSPTCPCDRLVPLEVSGVVTLGGEPIAAPVTLWDSHYTDNANDDSRIVATLSRSDGRYQLAADVRAAGCGNGTGAGTQYYVAVQVDGVVSAETGEEVDFGGSDDVDCWNAQIVDFDLDLTQELARP